MYRVVNLYKSERGPVYSETYPRADGSWFVALHLAAGSWLYMVKCKQLMIPY